MKNNFEELAKKIRTKEELTFFLEEIEREKLEKEGVTSELEKKLQSLPEMRLEIAFFPKDDFITKISQWLEKEFGQKIILDFIINPKVIGGAIIEYQGHWRDFSLAKEVDKFIAQYGRI